jgi:hypothetical protein
MIRPESGFDTSDVQTIPNTVPAPEVATTELDANEEVCNIYDKQLTNWLPDNYKVDATALLGRPFFIGSFEWQSTQPVASIVNLPIKHLPRDVFNSNPTLKNTVKMASIGRPALKITVSLAGTIGHSGCLLVGVIPPTPTPPTGFAYDLINTVMSGPHGFLFANESTNITIPVPWYCNTDFGTLEVDDSLATVHTTSDILHPNGSYATLVCIVMNALLPSSGSSTTLPINLEASFDDLEMYVPAPRYLLWESPSGFRAEAGVMASVGSALAPIAINSISTAMGGVLTKTASSVVSVVGDFYDGVRKKVRRWFGLHNPNTPVINSRIMHTDLNFRHQVDVPQFFEKLDPYAAGERIVKAPLYNTDVDEMDVTNILSKRQYVGTFKVLASDTVGKLLWARPISPFQGFDSSTRVANNISLLYMMARAWRGDIKITIQSSMNNKQHCALRLIRYMQPVDNVVSYTPTYKTIANAPSHFLEYSQGGIQHTIDMHYLARNDIIQISDDVNADALVHGIYYIYLAMPLVSSDGSPEEVSFNVFIECPNVELYGYSTKRIKLTGFPAFSPVSSDSSILLDRDPRAALRMSKPWYCDTEMEPLLTEENDGPPDRVFKPESGFNPQIKRCKEQNEGNEGGTDTHNSRLVRIGDMRQLIRRMFTTQGYKLPAEIGLASATKFTFPLGPLIGLGESSLSSGTLVNPIRTISCMYYAKNVGFKIRLEVFGPPDKTYGDAFDVKLYFLPPNMNIKETPADGPYYARSPPNSGTFPCYGDVYPGELYTPALDCNNSIVKPHSVVYEFVVPETHVYKFLGGPNIFKINDNSSVTTQSIYSIEDAGSIVLAFNNHLNVTIPVNIELSFGLTDESRMGMQTIAPPFTIVEPLYLGGLVSNQPDINGRPTIYYTRY